ncbi:MAG: nitroreductase family protein [Chloroflexi bacterium]|nr:nitroreductase family protein [Chloroflexota bacterium]MDA1239422.1 nitroreductase family protein [Chloroflexota bacterium]
MQPISDAMSLFTHQRAVRAFSDRPVDDVTLGQILQAALHAPSSQNGLPWRFIVVRDAAVKDPLSDLYEECYAQVYGENEPDRAEGREPWSKTPVLVAVCVPAPNGRTSMMTGASVYPACQNAMLAARALGLGSVLTTLWRLKKDPIYALLEVPEGWEIAAILALGWPDRAYGPNRRPPLEQFVMHNRWDPALQ